MTKIFKMEKHSLYTFSQHVSQSGVGIETIQTIFELFLKINTPITPITDLSLRNNKSYFEWTLETLKNS